MPRKFICEWKLILASDILLQYMHISLTDDTWWLLRCSDLLKMNVIQAYDSSNVVTTVTFHITNFLFRYERVWVLLSLSVLWRKRKPGRKVVECLMLHESTCMAHVCIQIRGGAMQAPGCGSQLKTCGTHSFTEDQPVHELTHRPNKSHERQSAKLSTSR